MFRSPDSGRRELASKLILSTSLSFERSLELLACLGDDEILYWLAKCSGDTPERGLVALAHLVGREASTRACELPRGNQEVDAS